MHWIIERARESQKYIYFCFIDYAKAIDWALVAMTTSSQSRAIALPGP